MDTTGGRAAPAADGKDAGGSMDGLPDHSDSDADAVLGPAVTRFCRREGQTAESLILTYPHAAHAGLDALDVLAGDLLGHLDLHTEHQLLALALGLDELGRELRLRRHEADVTGDGVLRIEVDGDAPLRAHLQRRRLVGRQVDLHVHVLQVHQRQRLAAGGQHLARLGQAVKHAPHDG
jgi:hypothetical protein